ncbi:MAG: sigma-70 family RNA polymerase sigma factor [Erysipelotrichaceae bacterium]|nr:sigma-70 family RNA polymerase sigma factor [Erysipelotrichaceae bacterium]
MKSFEALIQENIKSIETYVRYRVEAKADGEDILQDVLMHAFKSFDDLENEESFKPWLISIARNKINDYYRKKVRILELPLDEDVQHVSLNRTINYAVYETLDKLTDIDQKILYMYFWHNMSVNEMAERLNIPLGTVKSRLHNARKHFKDNYPEEELRMSKMPMTMPEYVIRKTDKEPFETKWEELMGWFLIPKEGNKLKWGMYDYPERTLTEQFEMSCQGQAEIHGIRGVKVRAIEKAGKNTLERNFIAQLTDTHCRYLAESHEENGIEKVFTFLDGDAFINNWGFGPENIGNETNLKRKGLIIRENDKVTCDSGREVMDVVGRYDVTINNRTYDTVCLMDIGSYDENTISEQYIDSNGRTVLWRRFNKSNWRWNFDHHEEILDDKLKDNETITVDGVVCYHWYDCITDYVI